MVLILWYKYKPSPAKHRCTLTSSPASVFCQMVLFGDGDTLTTLFSVFQQSKRWKNRHIKQIKMMVSFRLICAKSF